MKVFLKVVLTVVIVLSVLHVGLWFLRRKVHRKYATASLLQYRIALVMYEDEHGHYPNELSYEALKGFMGSANFGETVWGWPFHYELTTNGYTLVSAGYDRKLGTKDDIVGQ